MVHVQRGEPDAQVRAQAVEQIQQHDRVDTAAQGRDETVPGPDQPGELRGYAGNEIGRGGFTAAPLP